MEKAAKEIGYAFSGVETPANDKDVYAIRYNEFVVPLVEAVQELSKENEELKKNDEELKKKNDAFEARLQNLEALITSNNNAMSMNVSSAYLEQNAPNPSRSNAIIRYGIPDGSTSARLNLTNSKGQVLKTLWLFTACYRVVRK